MYDGRIPNKPKLIVDGIQLNKISDGNDLFGIVMQLVDKCPSISESSLSWGRHETEVILSIFYHMATDLEDDDDDEFE